MFGFATNETEVYAYSGFHNDPTGCGRRLTEESQERHLELPPPDGKTQVTVEFLARNDKRSRLDAVVLSTQHDENVSQGQIHADIKRYVFDDYPRPYGGRGIPSSSSIPPVVL